MERICKLECGQGKWANWFFSLLLLLSGYCWLVYTQQAATTLTHKLSRASDERLCQYSKDAIDPLFIYSTLVMRRLRVKDLLKSYQNGSHPKKRPTTMMSCPLFVTTNITEKKRKKRRVVQWVHSPPTLFHQSWRHGCNHFVQFFLLSSSLPSVNTLKGCL